MKSFNKYLLHPFDSSTCMKTRAAGLGGLWAKARAGRGSQSPSRLPRTGCSWLLVLRQRHPNLSGQPVPGCRHHAGSRWVSCGDAGSHVGTVSAPWFLSCRWASLGKACLPSSLPPIRYLHTFRSTDSSPSLLSLSSHRQCSSPLTGLSPGSPYLFAAGEPKLGTAL